MTAVALLTFLPAAGLADNPEDRGRTLLTELCARCHAVGRTGASPLPNAPPFRMLLRRFEMNELIDRMQNGLVSTHGEMPTFHLRQEDVRAVRMYLYSIQE